MSEAAKVQESVQCFGRKVGWVETELYRRYSPDKNDIIEETQNIILMKGIII